MARGDGGVPTPVTLDETATDYAIVRPADPSSRIGRYRVLGKIGEGGRSVVLEAHDPELDRRVAIKVLHHGGHEPTPERRERVLREARALARVVHPNIVAAY